MKNYFRVNRATLVFAFALMVLAAFTGCAKKHSPNQQGYVEGEFVYLAAPLAGQLEKLAVTRGAQVAADAVLFTLEHAAEDSALREANGRLRQSQARLADLQKGQRPSELAAIEARLAQSRAAVELTARELDRATKLHATQVLSDDDFDRVRLSHETNTKLAAEVAAQLDTARLGARTDTVAAAEADTAAAQAAVDRAHWNVTHKTIRAPKAALVYDTLYREGEFVAAGQPVVALLPPENIKVRFFVSEALFATLKTGAPVKVAITGRDTPLDARISYLSPKPEYTPPVLYNRENRAKLVFMVEAVFDSGATDLHPGQPADVTLAN